MTRLLLALALLGMTAAGCTSNEAGSAAPASASTTVDSSTTSTTATPSTAAPTVTAEPPPEPVPVETTVYRETAPAVPVVVIGEQCFSRGETAATSDGSTAYCSRQAGWGKNIWSLNPTLAPNPELQESTHDTADLGGVCYDDSATTTDPQGRVLYCNPKVDGEYPGTMLLWHLVP